MSFVPIYLDYASTTPVTSSVAKAMMACLEKDGNFANPASRSHMLGWQAESAVENARAQLANLINADTREIVWTSGATEANNLAIKGCIEGLIESSFDLQNNTISNSKVGEKPATKIVLISSEVEHKAVLDTCTYFKNSTFAKLGVEVILLKSNSFGGTDFSTLVETVKKYKDLYDTNIQFIVSLMHVNNETGAINDINRIGRFCREEKIIFHVDAAQSTGKLPIDVRLQNIDLLSISAHKFYGPKGVGALFVRRTEDVIVKAQIHGGGHERGMRSGTLPTHQIVGLGAAAELAQVSQSGDFELLSKLREQFVSGLNCLSGISINSDLSNSFPGIVSVCFHGIDGETMMMSLRRLAISSGSACTSASIDPSYVLTAMGLTNEDAQSSLRFSFGRNTTSDDIAQALNDIEQAYKAFSPGKVSNISISTKDSLTSFNGNDENITSDL